MEQLGTYLGARDKHREKGKRGKCHNFVLSLIFASGLLVISTYAATLPRLPSATSKKLHLQTTSQVFEVVR